MPHPKLKNDFKLYFLFSAFIHTMTDSTVTALDYIQRQEELEKEAKEVLPGKFEKCTFPLGYIRQPLYACKTCQTDDSTPAAMCYSCSMACHPEHELYELFPKRHFRCDCGLVDKFNNHPCALMIPAKKIIKANTENKYNHNFHGRYCRYFFIKKREKKCYYDDIKTLIDVMRYMIQKMKTEPCFRYTTYLPCPKYMFCVILKLSLVYRM